jgi:hypothetical protein
MTFNYMKNKFVLALLLTSAMAISAYGQKNHSQKNENANLTPEQQMSRDNDKVHKKKSKAKNDTTKKKVKRAKKNDRANRRKKN